MNQLPRHLIILFVLICLLFPFGAILWRANYLGFPLGAEVGTVVLATALQALASAAAAMFFGILGGLGFLWATARFERVHVRWLEGLVLLPNAAPALLMLLVVMKLFPWARGFYGIVLIHALLNLGLVAVTFAQLVSLKIAGFAELALCEGASGWKFFFRGALPVLRRDLGLVFMFIFALCFASFAIPLAIGGSRATTVEVLIYQKIRLSGDWSQALGLALMQMFVIFFFSWVLKRGEPVGLAGTPRKSPLLSWAPGLLIAVVPTLLLLYGLSDGLRFHDWQVYLPSLADELPRLLAGSCLVGFTTGFTVVAFLAAIAFAMPEGSVRNFLAGYAAPSSVLTGFALLLVWRDFGIASYFKISLGLSLVLVPAFYRLQWEALLDSLRGQVAVASTLGAGSWLIFARVVWPQLARSAFVIGGFASLWAWGDFALSSIVAERSLTVAQSAREMMDSYRFNVATVLVWILMAGGLTTFAIFAGAGNVLGSKSETRV